ncbi:LOW QUALITY PROTEIN: uncharacterized protein mettl21ca [Odontesthes bonariensis]
MDYLSTSFVEKTNCMTSEVDKELEEEGWDEEDKEDERGDSQTKESADGKQEKTAAWAPRFYYRAGKEVYNYVNQEIIIEEALDSYAGMIWPAALDLCHYLESHCDRWSLVDKAVLEIGAGTGLVSVVAALLGGWVTATDLPEVLSNLRVNLCRNTTGRCRHTPQVAALSWGYDLESTYPTSVYRYDYVLAADVVYHHDFLDELLATMKHFCKPGTTLIWANKFRFESDFTFTENFKKAFHTSLLAEDGEMKIFMATSRDGEQEGGEGLGIKDLPRKDVEEETLEDESKGKPLIYNEAEPNCIDQEQEFDILEDERRDEGEENNELDSDEQEEIEEMVDKEDDSDEPKETAPRDEDISRKEFEKQAAVQHNWVPRVIYSQSKDVYHYVEDIVIYETIDSYGGTMWPAALALCSFLENNRQTVNLQGKEVLELGAGTGLVAIVASLLGASVTATDLPEMLSNLRANVMRNTRGRCRHTPQLAALSWGYDLERTYTSPVCQYDYVLAADVVYHHDFLDELLATMKHFCKPGTTLIWANKFRFESDFTFTENFKKAFHTSLLAEDGEMKIFTASSRDGE